MAKKKEKNVKEMAMPVASMHHEPSMMTLYGKHAKGDSKTKVGAMRTMMVKAKKVGHNIDEVDGGHRARYELKGVYDHKSPEREKFNIYKKEGKKDAE